MNVMVDEVLKKLNIDIEDIDLYWVISSQEKVVGTVEQDLGLFAIGSYFGTPKMWIQTRNAGLLQEMHNRNYRCLVRNFCGVGLSGWPPPYHSEKD